MTEVELRGDFLFRKPNHSDQLLKSLNSLRKDGLYTDFSLHVENSVIQCHKIVLASLIPYFNSMFSSNLCENQINTANIKEIKMDILQMVIDFSYSGEILMTENNVEDVLKAATFFQIHSLRNACCKYLTQLLEPSNVIGVYTFAELFSCTQLEEAAFRYMLHNFGFVSKSQEFLELSTETVVKLLSEDKLKSVSEEQVYSAVVRWARHDLETRKLVLHQVMSCVRFGLMSREKLKELSQGEDSLVPIINQLSSKCYPLRHFSNQPRDPQRLHRRIYIAGGIGSGVNSALSSVQSYNPDTDTWEDLTNLTYPRFGAGLVARLGSLYMIGGHTGSSYINSVEKYDFEGHCWVTLPGIFGPTRRYFSTIGVDGKIMIMGGCDTVSYKDTAAVLDIASKQLIFAGKMTEQRVYCGCAVLKDVVYVVGGYGLCHQYSRLNSVEKYDQLTGSWEPVASLHVPRSGLGVVAIDNKVFAVGGFDGTNYLNSVEEYDPYRNEWKLIAPMKHARRAHGAASINGYIYVYGGFDGSKFLSSVERYDPYLKIWESMTDMPSGKAYFGSTVV